MVVSIGCDPDNPKAEVEAAAAVEAAAMAAETDVAAAEPKAVEPGGIFFLSCSSSISSSY